jgi:chlorobactene glucosyltransferase
LLTPEHILFAGYLIIGPCAWIGLTISLRMGYLHMNRLLKQRYAVPDPAPTATIIIPVKDEAPRIGDCMTAVLGQDYPSFDVVAVDDRSTDGTGQILDEIAANSGGKLKVLHVPKDGLPEGWTGKPNALHIGSQHARGQWLMFVDSDVIVQPNLLSDTVGICAARKYDSLSLLTKMDCHTAWEKLVLPVAAGAWAVMNTISWTNDDGVKVALANGQVLLIRRGPYDKVGGHAAVRHKMLEDIALMRALKSAGFTTRFLLGYHLASTRMYSSVAQTFRGWGRIYATTNDRSPWRIVASIAFLLVCGVSFFGAVIWGALDSSLREQLMWFSGAALHYTAATAYLWQIYRFSANPGWRAIFFPITTIVLLAMLLYSLGLCWTGRIIWRGTSYVYRPDRSSSFGG